MARFSVIGNRTGSATLGVLEVDADATRPRRGKAYEFIFGSEAAAADNPFLWTVDRVTAPGAIAGTGVTPSPLDAGDAATETDALENLTTNPTVGATLLAVGLNQRNTFRWVAYPGSEFVWPATDGLGIIVLTPTTAAVAINSTCFFEEQ